MKLKGSMNSGTAAPGRLRDRVLHLVLIEHVFSSSGILHSLDGRVQAHLSQPPAVPQAHPTLGELSHRQQAIVALRGVEPAAADQRMFGPELLEEFLVQRLAPAVGVDRVSRVVRPLRRVAVKRLVGAAMKSSAPTPLERSAGQPTAYLSRGLRGSSRRRRSSTRRS